MESTLKKFIQTGNFLEAKKLLKDIGFKEFRDLLFIIGYDDQNICSYTFICFLLIEKETVEYHFLASELLNFAFPYLVGGYATSLYHTQRAIALDPHNIEFQANLLFFNDIPEKLISDEEAKKIAHNVLQKKPDNPIALDFLSTK